MSFILLRLKAQSTDSFLNNSQMTRVGFLAIRIEEALRKMISTVDKDTAFVAASSKAVALTSPKGKELKIT